MSNASCGPNIDGEAPILIRNEQRQRAHPRPKRRHGLGSRRELYRQLWGFADPRPDPWQAVKGIEHKNLLHPEPEAREYMHWRKTSKYKLDDFRTEDVKWVLAREDVPDPEGSTAAGEDRHLRDVWSLFFATSELLDM